MPDEVITVENPQCGICKKVIRPMEGTISVIFCPRHARMQADRILTAMPNEVSENVERIPGKLSVAVYYDLLLDIANGDEDGEIIWSDMPASHIMRQVALAGIEDSLMSDLKPWD